MLPGPGSDAVRAALLPDEPPVKAWRAVEAQHVVSTLRLVNQDVEQQDLLERILDEAKPSPPPATRGLHYLLATPFRYPSPHPGGSRFRGPQDPGVLYAAVERRTACAEMGYWRWRFVRASEGLLELAASPQTLFQAGVRGIAVRLDRAPLARWKKLWTDRTDYAATQALAREAREKGVARILYTSVRDLEAGLCVAVLDPAALRPKRPVVQETWYLAVTPGGVVWQRDGERFVFAFDA